MAKRYKDIKLEEQTYKRFKQAKKLLEFQNNTDYSMSDFMDILIDNIGKNLPNFLNKMEKK